MCGRPVAVKAEWHAMRRCTVAIGPRSMPPVSRTSRSLRRSSPRYATRATSRRLPALPRGAARNRFGEAVARRQGEHRALAGHQIEPGDTVQARRRMASRGEGAKAVAQPGATVVDAGELAGHVVERDPAERIGAGGRIDRPAHQASVDSPKAHRRRRSETAAVGRIASRRRRCARHRPTR